MRDPQEKHPIDERFHQAFEQLPATPASNGWDSPSAKVWDNIQQEIQPRKNPLWNTRSWILLAFVSIALGVWWWNRPAPAPVEQPVQTPVQQPLTPTEAPATAPLETPAAADNPEAPASAKEAPVKPAPANKSGANAVEPVNSKEAERGTKAENPRNSKSEALPGSKSSARNTTEQKVGN
jgi:cytoskeletal protein RodZ